MKLSTTYTYSVEVACPACGEPQPSPVDGSHIWSTSDLKAKNGEKRACVSCDVKFALHAPTKVVAIYP